jgi:cation:H+ antiporter
VIWELIAVFVVESLVIVVAGVFLVRYADALGEHLKLGHSMAGLLLLALATSLPELLVGCHAANMGAIDMATGDLLGSSLFNLLILSVLDLMTLTTGRILSRTASAHALSAIVSILLTVLVLLFLVLKMNVSYGPIGLGSIIIGVVYLFCLRLLYLDQQFSIVSDIVQDPELIETKQTQISLKKSVVGYLVTTAVIFFVAPRLAATSVDLAEATGLGGTFFGTVFVALVTSLPEAVTSFSAIRIGAIDMAIGNIFGSNAFNMVMFIGLDLAYGGPLWPSVQSVHVVTAAAVILVTSVATLGLLYRAEKRWWVFEPDALLVVILIAGALVLVYRLGAVG